MPEIMRGKEDAAHLVEYVHRWRWQLAVIFHDAIPFDTPAFAAPGEPGRTRRLHALLQRGRPDLACF